MNSEIKQTRRATHVYYTMYDYQSIQHSRVAWRKKASYRMKIKRRTSKMIRRELKALDHEYTNS
jgi:carbon monoxide dehydrogenase subunit G